MSEPTAQTRRRIGVWAIGFLVVFIGVGRWLNSVFWRDVK
jgi:cytochrome c1